MMFVLLIFSTFNEGYLQALILFSSSWIPIHTRFPALVPFHKGLLEKLLLKNPAMPSTNLILCHRWCQNGSLATPISILGKRKNHRKPGLESKEAGRGRSLIYGHQTRNQFCCNWMHVPFFDQNYSRFTSNNISLNVLNTISHNIQHTYFSSMLILIELF